ncbi:MAG: UDP-2,3-diacylglucosamine diphosphatase LpxI [Pseudomonadota bacterium]
MARAILAGRGALPGLLMQAGPAELVTFAGVTAAKLPRTKPIEARFERLGEMFEALRARGITELCLAGAMTRPSFDAAALDGTTRALLPRLMMAMGRGDDGLLREVMAILEEQGFKIVAAQDLRPDLVAEAGNLVSSPSPAQLKDAERGRAVLAALAPLDVGQSAVVARGQLLGIETLQGTDAMLAFVVATAKPITKDAGGVLIKRPKAGQDLRVDVPVIGPKTIAAAAEAGLKGIEIAAGSVLLLDRAKVIAAAQTMGLALWAAP